MTIEKYVYWFNKAQEIGLTKNWLDAYAVTATRAQQNMPTQLLTDDKLPIVKNGKLVENKNWERDYQFNLNSEH